MWIAAEHAVFTNQGTTSVDLFRKSGGSWPSKQLGVDQLVNDGGIGSPVESVDWDVETETLHAAFVAKRDSQFGAYDVRHWSVPGSTLCP
ncbi:MAG: hypothetical protein ABMA64_38835 [Myxococcota bacterium]